MGVRVAHNGGAHAVCLAVLGSNNDCLANGATTRLELLVGMFVFLLAADEGFVHLDRPGKRTYLGLKHLAKTVQHEPCGFLADAKLAVEFHA